MNDILTEKEYQRFILDRLHDNEYIERDAACYDRRYAVDSELLFKFLADTQPEQMAALEKQYKDKVKETILSAYNQAVTHSSGSLILSLRHGIEISGQHLHLMYTRPATDFNKELMHRYQQNIFSVMEEVWADDKQRIDLVIFLNGIAIMSLELKCNAKGQSYQDAIYQYRHDRDPKNRLFLFKSGCIVNFAMDLEEVYMTTRIEGESAFFLPFNRGKGQGKARGAGNEINPDTGMGVGYMWQEILQKDMVLELLARFVFLSVKEKANPATGTKKKQEALIFPRYHQLECVCRLLADVGENGAGRNYLIQHSAGSGKTNSIAWLAHHLASLHNKSNQQIFDNIIIVTDRVVVDRQLQRAVLSLEHKSGMIRVMDDKCTSADLARALQGNTKIVGTTIQKFPYIVDAVKNLKDKHFAVIIDEAHSSTAGKDMSAITKALASGDSEEGDIQDIIQAEIRRNGKQDNVSFFAFTATPKPTTLLFFGRLNEHGQHEAFHLYSMKQAIEEGFILDVLSSYTTYTTLYNINKAIEDDPQYKTSEAKRKIHLYAMLHDTNIAQRIQIIVEHFRTSVMQELGGEAKAMVITGQRLEAARYKQAFDEYIERKGYSNIKTLVAFSGKVKTEEQEYTEAGLNGFSEHQTARKFDTREYQVMIVANKYQTGFDQPRLCAMYIMKKLRGVNAVQTLSRLNRICPPYDKKVFVLDFVNSYEDMEKAFAPYYETTLLANSATPQAVYAIADRIEAYHVIDPDDLEKFNSLLYGTDGKTQNIDERKRKKLLFYLERAKGKIQELELARQQELVRELKHFRRFYEFLLLVSGLEDAELHQLYRFADYLVAMLNIRHPGGGFDIRGKIKAINFANKKTGEHHKEKMTARPVIKLPEADVINLAEEKRERLSAIIQEINSRMGKSYDSDVAAKSMLQIKDILMKSEILKKAAQSNTEQDFEFSYNEAIDDALIDGLSQNQDFFGLLLNNDSLKKEVMGIFVDQVYRELRVAEHPDIAYGASLS